MPPKKKELPFFVGKVVTAQVLDALDQIVETVGIAEKVRARAAVAYVQVSNDSSRIQVASL